MITADHERIRPGGDIKLVSNEWFEIWSERCEADCRKRGVVFVVEATHDSARCYERES